MVGIKLDMPASCYECRLNMAGWCGMAVIMELPKDKLEQGETKPAWCPLISLEAEERTIKLIDVDKKHEADIEQINAPTGVLYGYAVAADTKAFHPAADLVRCCDFDLEQEKENEA